MKLKLLLLMIAGFFVSLNASEGNNNNNATVRQKCMLCKFREAGQPFLPNELLYKALECIKNNNTDTIENLNKAAQTFHSFSRLSKVSRAQINHLMENDWGLHNWYDVKKLEVLYEIQKKLSENNISLNVVEHGLSVEDGKGNDVLCLAAQKINPALVAFLIRHKAGSPRKAWYASYSNGGLRTLYLDICGIFSSSARNEKKAIFEVDTLLISNGGGHRCSETGLLVTECECEHCTYSPSAEGFGPDIVFDFAYDRAMAEEAD